MRTKDRIAVDSLELEYEVHGSGDPVVLIHWGVSATWAEPLLEETALADHHRLLSYHRAGFGRSGRVTGAVTMVDHAEHCRLLMSRLGIERAHLVGHSSSVAVALQLALDAPDAVQTVVSLDAARPVPTTETQSAFVDEFVVPAIASYRAGDVEGAVDRFFRGVFGPHYRDPLEHGLPGAFADAVSAAYTFFGQELPALQGWSFSADEAARIAQPVLVVTGERSAATFHERRDLLLSWLPNAESYDLPEATHLLHVENPRGLAEALAAFFARHPLATA